MHRPLFPLLKQYAHTDMRKIPATAAEALSQNMADLQDKDTLARLFARYRVSAVIAGHEHLFYKSTHEGVPYYVVGGGGAEFSVPPEQGGFLSYLLVEVSGREVKITVMEPYHFFVDYRYYQQGRQAAAEARLENICYQKLTLDLKGLKFTLPPGRYILKSDTIPFYELVKQANPDYARSWLNKVEASIITEEVNAQDPALRDYYVRVKSPRRI